MQALLRAIERAVTRRPVAVLVALAAATTGFAGLASTLHLEVDLTQFGREDSETVQAMTRIREEFDDPSATVQVIVDAGPGGDVLTADGLAAVASAQATTVAALGPDVRLDPDGAPQLLSVAGAVRGAAAQQGLDLTTLDDDQLGRLVAEMVTANPALGALLSADADLSAGTARATLVVAMLDPELDEDARSEAAMGVRDAVAAADLPGSGDVEVTVFSSGLLVAGLLDAVRAEVPRLFGLALLVVIAILAFAYRSAFDVAIGVAGLVATVVWTFGSVALIGPGFLGWRGPLSQLGVIVPVLLVGLGIDYSVHLTARYREQRAAAQPPAAAAGRALHTVGAALVLATVATAVGFAANATAPLAMIADFGVFVAIGVVCAFVVMALLVPAARVLRDRRPHAMETAAVRELGLTGVLRGPIALARRAPLTGLVVGGLLVAASLVAAAGLDTVFDRDDFIPEGSEVAATLAHQAELFGGAIAEFTFVLIDGAADDAAVAAAVEDGATRLQSVDGVEVVAGPPRWREDGQAAVVQTRTSAGDIGAPRLRADIEAAFAPATAAGAAVTVTSEPLIIGEMSAELSSFQLRAIVVTLLLVMTLLAGYYGAAHRRPVLGLVAMIPAVVSAALILGAMWAFGIAINVLSATLTAIAVGIGVPYGVHLVNRFVEDRADGGSVDAVVARTLRGTGGALVGSALTTLGAFVVLSFSGLAPIQQLGRLGGTGIAFALLAALLVEPGALSLWARREDGRERPAVAPPRHDVHPVG